MHITDTANFPADELKAIVAAANAWAEAPSRACQTPAEQTAWLERTFAEADIVRAVWPDETVPYDVGLGVLKGLGRLKPVSQMNASIEQKVANVRCRDVNEAEAMCRVFGDDRPLHPEYERAQSRQARRAAMRAKR